RGRDRRQRGGYQQRAGESLQAAEDDERIGGGGHCAEDGGGPEGADTEREDAHLAEDVSERAADEDQRPEGEEIRVDDPLLGGEPTAQIPLDRRQGHVDHGSVDEGDRRAEDRGDRRKTPSPDHVSDTIRVNRSGTWSE